MLLLAPPAGDVRGIRVEATASSHLEGIRCRPDFQPLRDMLRSTSYPNEVHAIGSGSQSRGFTFSQLQDALGASAEEIRDALRAEGAVQVQETWFGLKPEFKAELVRMILLSCEAEGWHLTSVTDTEMR